MSERFTTVRLGTVNCGTRLCERGLKTHSEMVQRLREMAQRGAANAQMILAAKKEDFIVETYIGLYAERKKRRIYPGE